MQKTFKEHLNSYLKKDILKIKKEKSTQKPFKKIIILN
jgi:hypothetical protein